MIAPVLGWLTPVESWESRCPPNRILQASEKQNKILIWQASLHPCVFLSLLMGNKLQQAYNVQSFLVGLLPLLSFYHIWDKLSCGIGQLLSHFLRLVSFSPDLSFHSSSFCRDLGLWNFFKVPRLRYFWCSQSYISSRSSGHNKQGYNNAWRCWWH